MLYVVCCMLCGAGCDEVAYIGLLCEELYFSLGVSQDPQTNFLLNLFCFFFAPLYSAECCIGMNNNMIAIHAHFSYAHRGRPYTREACVIHQ